MPRRHSAETLNRVKEIMQEFQRSLNTELRNQELADELKTKYTEGLRKSAFVLEALQERNWYRVEKGLRQIKGLGFKFGRQPGPPNPNRELIKLLNDTAQSIVNVRDTVINSPPELARQAAEQLCDELEFTRERVRAILREIQETHDALI